MSKALAITRRKMASCWICASELRQHGMDHDVITLHEMLNMIGSMGMNWLSRYEQISLWGYTLLCELPKNRPSLWERIRKLHKRMYYFWLGVPGQLEHVKPIQHHFVGHGIVPRESHMTFNKLFPNTSLYTPEGVNTDMFRFRPKSFNGNVGCAIGDPVSRDDPGTVKRPGLIKECITQTGLKFLFVNNLRYEKMPTDFYGKCSIYVCFSEQEGSPRPVLEALSSGIPVISTKVGMIPHLIEEGCDITVVNDKKSLTEAIKDVSQNYEHHQNLGAQNRKIMQDKFQWSTVIPHWKSVMEL